MKTFPALLFLMLTAPFVLGWQEVEGEIPAPAQPGDERAQQDGLPQAHDPLWVGLGQCRIGYNEKSGLYTIALTPQVKQLADQTVSASGFILPLDSSDRTRHFLLTKRTPVCLYCAPGEPNEVIEVYSEKPVTWSEDLINVTGKFSLVDNGDQGIFFAIKDAQTSKPTTIDRFLGGN